MEHALGPVDSFQEFPALVEIGQGYFYLTKRVEGGYALLSTLCPHAGGEVFWEGITDEFVCPLHGWRFDPQGNCGDMPGNGLQSHPVELRENQLVAIIELGDTE